ncbi:hypothetical protein X975_06721, partial [Stegodyphus mimosarum]
MMKVIFQNLLLKINHIYPLLRKKKFLRHPVKEFQLTQKLCLMLKNVNARLFSEKIILRI